MLIAIKYKNTTIKCKQDPRTPFPMYSCMDKNIFGTRSEAKYERNNNNVYRLRVKWDCAAVKNGDKSENEIRDR